MVERDGARAGSGRRRRHSHVADVVLRSAGYEVVVAAGGSEALQIVEAQRPFDVFMIDVVMPQMYGDELARQLRQRHPDMKVLYFTGYSDYLFKEKPTLWAKEAYLDKPATSRALLEAVSLVLFGHTNGPGGGRPGSAA
jgi:two-component system cell cycle sensor histidine kinase/response regulator CckA